MLSIPCAITPPRPISAARSGSQWMGLKSPDAPAYFTSWSRVTGSFASGCELVAGLHLTISVARPVKTSSPAWSRPSVSTTTNVAVPSRVSFSFTSAIFATHVMRSPGAQRPLVLVLLVAVDEARGVDRPERRHRQPEVEGRRECRRRGGAVRVGGLVVADRLGKPHDCATLDVERDRLGRVADIRAVDGHGP